MHELSIAGSIADLATEEARSRNVHVLAVHLKLGALSGIVEDALLGSYEMVTAGTPLEGSRLLIERVPVVAFCHTCNALRTIPSIQSMRCPECDTLAPDVREGRELQVFALEVNE
jgi:hydrogenase nickel incorporation protein HypA/HybF